MKIILTRHARKRMAERNVSLDEVRKIVEMPSYTVKKNGKVEAYGNVNNRAFKII